MGTGLCRNPSERLPRDKEPGFVEGGVRSHGEAVPADLRV